MDGCPTKCPNFKKYIDSLKTIATSQEALDYINQLATSPDFAKGVKLYSDGNGVYSDAKGSPYQLLGSLMDWPLIDKKVESVDKAKLLLGYSLRRIAETGECGLSNTMLEAARKSGMFEDEIGLELLEEIKGYSSQIGLKLSECI